MLISSYRFKNILSDTWKWKTLNAEYLCKMEVCFHVLLSISIIQFAPPHQETMYLTKNRLHLRSQYYNKIKSTMSHFQFHQSNEKITWWHNFLFFSCISEIWPSITDNSFWKSSFSHFILLPLITKLISFFCSANFIHSTNSSFVICIALSICLHFCDKTSMSELIAKLELLPHWEVFSSFPPLNVGHIACTIWCMLWSYLLWCPPYHQLSCSAIYNL